MIKDEMNEKEVSELVNFIEQVENANSKIDKESLIADLHTHIDKVTKILAIDRISGNGKYRHILCSLYDTKRAIEEDTKQAKYCSNCGTKLYWWDTDGIQIHHMAYGSKYDMEILNIKLCTECTDKVIDMIKDKSL